ncbi:MAG: hypothetical protein SNJ61_10915 [Fimbriimonadaceae bacterium]
MHVPPFIPQPIEIPRNVTTERYGVRLGFVRRVAALHFLSVGLVAAGSSAPWPEWSPWWPAGGTLGMLVVLTLVRALARGRHREQLLSISLAPILLIFLAWLVRDLAAMGWPMWAPAIGLGCAVAYALTCGRDLSFVAMVVIPTVVSSMLIALAAYTSGLPAGVIGSALALNFAFVFYIVYDLASLLSRRRLREEAGAVVDLYRDILNFLGYGVRVVRHWRRHRIWTR